MVKAKINWLVYTSAVKFQSSPADVFPSPVQQDSELRILGICLNLKPVCRDNCYEHISGISTQNVTEERQARQVKTAML